MVVRTPLLIACAAAVVAVLGAVGGAAPVAGPAAPGAGTAGRAVSYGLPLAGAPDVARRFEAPATRWSAGHRGIDLRAAAGAQVLAPADGVVTFAGPVAGRGVVTVAHPDGRRSSVEPVSATVVVGTRVVRGQPVGTLAATGSHCSPAACVHWGVRVGSDYVDPLTLLPGAGPVVLLP